MVRIFQPFWWGETSSIPGQGTKISQAVSHSQKKKKMLIPGLYVIFIVLFILFNILSIFYDEHLNL